MRQHRDFKRKQFEADRQFSNIVLLFTSIAIFIAAMGILGLTGLMIHVCIKEIGIRKVLGATTTGLLLLFSKDFMRLVFLAFLIAVPIIYYTANKWLSNYAFRVDLTWIIWVLPLLLLATICLITIIIKSWNAMMINPAKMLRTE